MRRAFLVALLAAGGCGPMPHPMPVRLADDSQKEIDAAWDAALAPVGKYDRGRWLDALVGIQAYQAGIDTLTLRSEKRFAGGKVVMEIVFDRAKPDDDRFVVTVLDPAGAVARQERYSRADVERAAAELFDPARGTAPAPNEPPLVARRRAEADARWKQVEEMFPVRKADGK